MNEWITHLFQIRFDLTSPLKWFPFFYKMYSFEFQLCLLHAIKNQDIDGRNGLIFQDNSNHKIYNL